LSEDEIVKTDPLTGVSTAVTSDDGAPVDAAAPIVAATAQSNSWQKQAVKQVIGLVLAAGFLWLSFRNVNMTQLWKHLQGLNMMWVAAASLSSLLSHFLRALRWVIMLQPLADRDTQRVGNPKVSLWNSFCALIIGYAVNIVVPRGGEVARVVSICKSEKLPWAGVLPTMLIDRLLDFAMLVLLVGTAIVLLPAGIRSNVPWLVPAGGMLCAATLVGLVLLPKLGVILRAFLAVPVVQKMFPAKVSATIGGLTDQFEEGTACLSKPTAFPAIGALTIGMWGLYYVNMELMLFAFNMQDVVDPVRCLMVFALGSVGVVVPTPGSVGPYHLITSQALNMVAGIDPSRAMAYVTALHAITFVGVVCLAAALCFVIQATIRRKSV
jgi:uncharacterized protein (TIRG00374 family)